MGMRAEFSVLNKNLLRIRMSFYILLLFLYSINCCQDVTIENRKKDLISKLKNRISNYENLFWRTKYENAYVITFFRTKDEDNREYFTLLPEDTDYRSNSHHTNLFYNQTWDYEEYLQKHVINKQEKDLIHLKFPLTFPERFTNFDPAQSNDSRKVDIYERFSDMRNLITYKFIDQASKHTFFSLVFSKEKTDIFVYDDLVHLRGKITEKVYSSETDFEIRTANWCMLMYFIETNRILPQKKIKPNMETTD